MGDLHHLPPTVTAADIHTVLAADGAVIIDDLIDVATIERIETELAPWVEATPTGRDAFAGRATRRTGGLIARSPAGRDLVRHPMVLAVCDLLLARWSSYQLHLTQRIDIGPGEPAQKIHRDQWAFDFFAFPADAHAQCNTIWAFTDFTEENGATRLCPGTQDLPDDVDFAGPSVPAEMRAGSCLLYTGKVYHGGGANSSAANRVGMNITYCASWLRQEENQYLSCPPEIAAELDDDLLRLMGYRIGAYALGYIDDVRDPLTAVRGGVSTGSFRA